MPVYTWGRVVFQGVSEGNKAPPDSLLPCTTLFASTKIVYFMLAEILGWHKFFFTMTLGTYVFFTRHRVWLDNHFFSWLFTISPTKSVGSEKKKAPFNHYFPFFSGAAQILATTKLGVPIIRLTLEHGATCRGKFLNFSLPGKIFLSGLGRSTSTVKNP